MNVCENEEERMTWGNERDMGEREREREKEKKKIERRTWKEKEEYENAHEIASEKEGKDKHIK